MMETGTLRCILHDSGEARKPRVFIALDGPLAKSYKMAACLTRSAQKVQMVVVMDGATPQASKRTARIALSRLSGLRNALAMGDGDVGSALSPMVRWASIASTVIRKASNLVVYEVVTFLERLWIQVRFQLFKRLVRRNGSWPAGISSLNVMQIYTAIEAHYAPQSLSDVPLLLVRATAGHGTDTPFREIYRDEDLGWRNLARRLEIVDVKGGHSSMLQAHAVESLATAVLQRLVVHPISTTSE